MDTVDLRNTNKDMQREVFSADGDSVHIMPGKTVNVEAKFNWKLPPDVIVDTGSKSRVFGKKAENTTPTPVDDSNKKPAVADPNPQNESTTNSGRKR